MKSITKNFSYLTLSHSLEKLIKFAITIILIRYLEIEVYGIFALTVSYVGFFNHLLDGGFTLFVMKEIIILKEDGADFLGDVTSSKVLVGPFVLLVLLALSQILGYKDDTFLCIVIFSIATFIFTFITSNMSVFISKERSEYECLLRLTYSLLLIFGICVSLFISKSAVWVVTVYLISSVIVLFLSFFLLKKVSFYINFKLSYQKNKKLIKQALPFAIGAIMGEIFFNIDNVMISKFADIESVAYYNAAYKLSYSGVILANTMTLSVYPHISRSFSDDRKRFLLIFKKILLAILFSSLIISVVGSLFSRELILFIFGNDYLQSAELFSILIWSLPPLSIMHLTNRTLEALGEQSVIGKSMFVCVLINVTLNTILINLYGAYGACIATVITSFIIILIQSFYIWKKVRKFEPGENG